ncbi:hypothetical protein NEMBOFW57_009701 [Staphylotrichum longicolle]|uniref:Orc1-like AAA ATPase domain-containing protein n=1 Tax=Staphylotrichum longicolle TaxID=669026 RepID=A0AAD4EPT6_9PEZI|nr:hypothetical protein NEMBOFW57_009701 [Staphylotrichum longicolle]
MRASVFQLPDELILTTLNQTFPCRETQIRTLATLLYPGAAPCRNLVLYGTEATGKSAVTTALLTALADQPEDDGFSLNYAIVNSVECITARHLYESIVGKVADALAWDAAASRCETVSQLAVELSKMLKYTARPDGFRFVLVFDGIDRQRDAPHTLLPALARFKQDFISILSLSPPPTLPNTLRQETTDLWTRFTAAVHDALARAASRTLPSFAHACTALWPRFTAPIHAGTHSAREFSKLLVAARTHFQDERLLDPGHRKIARKLLGAHAFVLERMLAIFAAVRANGGALQLQGGRDGEGRGRGRGMRISGWRWRRWRV